MVSSAALSIEASVRENKFSSMDTRDDVKSRWFKTRQLLQSIQNSPFWSHRWLGWAFVYVSVLLVFLVDRSVGLSALIEMYGSDKDHTLGVTLGALGLGMLEDWICATYLVAVLWLIDFFLSQTLGASSDSMTLQTFIKWKRQRILRRGVTFVTSWLLFVATAAPFAVDMMLVRLRSMRFTFEIVSMAIAESDMVSSVAISDSEYKEAYITGTILALFATFFASVRTWTSWADLTRWNPTSPHPLLHLVRRICLRFKKDDELWTPKEEIHHGSSSSSDSYDDVNEMLLENGKLVQYAHTTTPNRSYSLSNEASDRSDSDVCERPTLCARVALWLHSADWLRLSIELLVALVALVFLPVAILAISQTSSPLIANVALDTTINELFVRALKVTDIGFVPPVADGTIEDASVYIHPTESYSLSANDSLYRLTTGFNGDLAFNVSVSDSNPPNVVVIVVESFRFHDSHYLVGEEDPSELFKGWNGTVVPNFDKWAKRGVAFSNLWSSWKTSRSLASLLFAQIPYDATQTTETAGARRDVELAGMPQFFKTKGYDTFFTTGTDTSYDDWDVFLPAHGFDSLWGEQEMMKYGESGMGISSEDWEGEAHRKFRWGVHDDVSFEILGNLLINKTNEQAADASRTPLFLTHYTISSHVEYEARPTWYVESDKPDFSALYDGEKHAGNVKKYLEMRYFTDMELGKFMDRMETAGVLNDTIVLIVGDHGQAPEFGNNTPEKRDVSCTHVAGALIAEGRLGDYVGLKIDDAAEQYDILNTLADIVGVPEEGFEQDGIGRSLKRKVTFGERVVYSNNPAVKNSVVRGHERLRYDRSTDSVLVHNSWSDHDMKIDLFPALSTEEKNEWRSWRDQGREVTAYFKKRWEEKCLLC
ncbi:sulfatase-like protein [Phytophthora infestans T30-4]|uniref:Sulfatase-like protein n=1 Tax=Phytophthora infestans (strain T30-4) TaxID=403677 RepID=D0NA32_PHYIT|nr:sulfatase-like protein [Phytophthora infestans T30-4]EEY54286.1 sulfatase-like protein [Phytophthora infestans T30-4]|eukprot:XP_002904108.1 sulfatase-like protein [Phytophthora infestans T30-4]